MLFTSRGDWIRTSDHTPPQTLVIMLLTVLIISVFYKVIVLQLTS